MVCCVSSALLSLSIGKLSPFPYDVYELLGLVRTADFFGIEDFMSYIAKRLECPVESLRNVQGSGKVRRKLRGILRAPQHSASKACVMCNQTLPPAPEFPSKPKKTPCCNSVRCNTCVMRKVECAHCSTSLKLLPCVFCHNLIRDHLHVPDQYDALASCA